MITYKSIVTALFFTCFIYFEYLGISSKFFNTLFAIMAIATLFLMTKKELFTSGFLIGVLWFWWIGYSFIYYDLIYLIPIVLFCIAMVYGVLFSFIAFYNHFLYKILCIFLISFIAPFGFNWFKIELPFINSYLGTSKIEFLLIVVSIGLFVEFRKKYKVQSFILLVTVFTGLFLYNQSSKLKIAEPQLKIYKYETNINQNEKWKRFTKQKIINENFYAINNAIKNKYDVIILPETAFPLVLNHADNINDMLLKMSKDISIVTGSLYEKNGLLYNSTYFYENAQVQIAHKVVLVPFGEAVPMPEKIRNFINDIFYDGAEDYQTAKEPTTFIIKGVKFRNAICYEATTDEIYKNLDTPYIIAISNNAWFTPSIQPTLQKLLMKYYSNKYNLYYIDVANETH